MKQVECHKSKYMQPLSDGRNSPDVYWNHQQKKSQYPPHGRGSRSPEALASYSFLTAYKPPRTHACSGQVCPKYTSSHGPDVSRHGPQSHSKLPRDKYAVNFSRKNRYDEESGNNEKRNYFEEELGNFTEDAEEDVEGEATEDEAGEFLAKDYDEQEADDEVDEESDAPQTYRAKRGKKEALLRLQRWRHSEQQQDPRRHCHQQCVSAQGQGHSSSPRYYHNVAEHDVSPAPSEEDFVPTSLKSPTRRSAADYHQWTPPSRGESDRYDGLAMPIQPRRARTKPEMDHLIESELGKLKKCNRCGSLSNKKSEPHKNNCRFDDRSNFPAKGPIGDEPGIHDQAYYGRSSLRHSSKDPNDVSSSPYSSKQRRSREVNSPPIYEVAEHNQLDHLSNDYSRSSSRYHRKAADVFPEKMKRSVHTSHDIPRGTRYEE
ncbi:uncharacterized protein LOC128879437 [Hylaeus volcanicus]|uniref:uncharacterized protein LOC128879437 n=1 Tax=Hylaeus volcanicus TaxID=313075 RepID=UPI0023B837CA|nr:uncharacterized protein LOC128879437 [Hylaeus volcanicus]